MPLSFIAGATALCSKPATTVALLRCHLCSAALRRRPPALHGAYERTIYLCPVVRNVQAASSIHHEARCIELCNIGVQTQPGSITRGLSWCPCVPDHRMTRFQPLHS